MFQVFTSFDNGALQTLLFSAVPQHCDTWPCSHGSSPPKGQSYTNLHQAVLFSISPRKKLKRIKKFHFCNHLCPLLEFNFLDLDLWKCHMGFIDMPCLVSIPFNSFSLSFVKPLPGAQHRKIWALTRQF